MCMSTIEGVDRCCAVIELEGNDVGDVKNFHRGSEMRNRRKTSEVTQNQNGIFIRKAETSTTNNIGSMLI